MHAYDLDNVSGNRIIVRRAKDGDEFQTLDGQVRKLDSEMPIERSCLKQYRLHVIRDL